MRFDVAQAQDAAHCADVEIAIVKRDAGRRLQAVRQDGDTLGAPVVVRIGQRIDLAFGARADEHRAFRTERELARVRYVGREHVDMEARGQRQLREIRRLGARGSSGGDAGREQDRPQQGSHRHDSSNANGSASASR